MILFGILLKYILIFLVQIKILRQSLEPLFWRFDHRTSSTSCSIGRATGFGSLFEI